MSNAEIVINSTSGKLFDIKTNKDLAPNGTGTGRLLNGKYVTARSAGNYLAGINATLTGYSYTYSMQLAGALHVGGKYYGFGAFLIGNSFGAQPWYGENKQCGRMFTRGWLKSIPNDPEAKEVIDRYINQ